MAKTKVNAVCKPTEKTKAKSIYKHIAKTNVNAISKPIVATKAKTISEPLAKAIYPNL